MVRLAQKAFFPGRIPFPLLHIDTTYKFREMIEFRDEFIKSIGAKLSEYDQLLLEREFAVKSLTSALTSLENARQDSQRQQLYLERIVEPNTPDQSRYPRRWLIIGFVGLMTVSIYVIVIKFRKSILEHHL